VSDELKPCPFCGSADVAVETIHRRTDGVEEYAGSCVNCGARGQLQYLPENAAAAWNHREQPKAEREQLTHKELLFLAELMEQGGNLISRQICEDMRQKAYGIFSPEEKDELERQYHDWNGDPEEFFPGYFMPNAWVWLGFYAAKFRQWAGGEPAKDGE
jgi:Lar family restriction alleviation protein